jgi:DNA polymerase III epsilon subunit-like protein
MSLANNLVIVFDTETTGFSCEYDKIVQLSYILYDLTSNSVVYATKPGDDIVKVDSDIPERTTSVHGITKEMTEDKRPIEEHIDNFILYCNRASKFVGHNIAFDIRMITIAIENIIEKLDNSDPKKEVYSTFLEKFRIIDKKLPSAAYCTMLASRDICALKEQNNNLKKRKLLEVHKLLFNQDVGGQLHNALVDISVTLRVYLKLTMNIDICESVVITDEIVSNVENTDTICNLIKPIPIINDTEQQVNYTGELITGLNILPTDLEKETINVESIAVPKTNKVIPQEILPLCTEINVCKEILASGSKKGQVCRRPVKENSRFCGYHINNEATAIRKTARDLVKDLLGPYTRNKKRVSPDKANKGGKRTTNKRYKQSTNK